MRFILSAFRAFHFQHVSFSGINDIKYGSIVSINYFLVNELTNLSEAEIRLDSVWLLFFFFCESIVCRRDSTVLGGWRNMQTR